MNNYLFISKILELNPIWITVYILSPDITLLSIQAFFKLKIDYLVSSFKGFSKTKNPANSKSFSQLLRF